jgi:hypothetical protein
MPPAVAKFFRGGEDACELGGDMAYGEACELDGLDSGRHRDADRLLAQFFPLALEVSH